MSTIVPPVANPQPTAAKDPGNLIQLRIDEACKALWWAELTRACLRIAIGSLAAVLGWVIFDQWVYSPNSFIRFLALCTLIAWICWEAYSRVLPLIGNSVRPEYAARSLERDIPDSKQQLTSYVTLKDEKSEGLRSRVIRSIGSRVAGQLKQHDVLPAEATGTLKWWLAAAGALALALGYAALSPKNSLASASRLFVPLASIEAPTRVSITNVEPGDSEAIAGNKIPVSCDITGKAAWWNR